MITVVWVQFDVVCLIVNMLTMYSLLGLTLLGLATGIPISEPDTRDTALLDAYVLPGESMPTFYDVQLFLDPGNPEYFNGSVSIRILPIVQTSTIVLHAMELDIENIEVYNDFSTVNLYLNHTLSTTDTHLLTITLNNAINAMVPHTINIDYQGHFAENMFGVYLSTYQEGQQNVNLITSQLQPTFARRAFPCYDEPALKAIFRTTIYAPDAYTVVRSNMPERNDTLKPDVTGWVKHEFDDTLLMSTYLIAYLVSNFDYIDNTANPIYRLPFRVYSRPGTQEHADFALEFVQENMAALENYTDFPYAFPKMDVAAVPDFAAGAMENWGLVIYREVALLVQEGVTTTSIRQNIARIICHENMHQWFGNEVGPLSWTYTWLNEGFANFFENFATDLVRPEYRMMDQFVIALQGVMQNDAVLSVNPMTFPVYTPSQILGTFNAVAYQKSGSVIRMTQHFLTPEVFRQGLAIYIRNNSRRAASPTDLYAAFQEALNESEHTIPYGVQTVLDLWTNQGGFPVIHVRRTSPAAESLYVSQERFLTDQTLTSSDRWHIPINWVLSTDIDFSDTRPQGWIPPTYPTPSFNIPGLSAAEWFIVNKQQTGYYRVNYDPENWEALARVLLTNYSAIHVLNRAQILDDSFNLARNGRLDYIHAFELSRYLNQEADYIPWASVNPAFSYLDIVLSGTPVYNYYQSYLLQLSAPQFEQLGFDAAANEEHVTPFYRNIILDINCRYNNPDCVSRAQDLLEQFRNNPDQQLNPDIQQTVFCSGLRGGDADNFNFLWDQYLITSDASQQSIILNALGCTSNEELREFYLNQVIDDNSPVREQDKHTVIVSVINSNPASMEAALDFVMEHFDEIQPRVQGLTGTTNILNAFSRRLNTQAHNTKIDEFTNRYSTIFSAGELAAIAAIKENIGASITWSNENLGTVDSWLRENYGSNANSITSSIFIVFSVVVAMFCY